MTYCSSQSIWWVQAICLQYWICRCKIPPQFCFYLSLYGYWFIFCHILGIFAVQVPQFCMYLSLYGRWFIFYHILGIFAVQVSLDAFVLYVAITLRIRNWVNLQQNFQYWRSWAWRFLHCQNNPWKLWRLLGAIIQFMIFPDILI